MLRITARQLVRVTVKDDETVEMMFKSQLRGLSKKGNKGMDLSTVKSEAKRVLDEVKVLQSQGYDVGEKTCLLLLEWMAKRGMGQTARAMRTWMSQIGVRSTSRMMLRFDVLVFRAVAHSKPRPSCEDLASLWSKLQWSHDLQKSDPKLLSQICVLLLRGGLHNEGTRLAEILVRTTSDKRHLYTGFWSELVRSKETTQEALAVFEQSRESYPPDTILYCSAIVACSLQPDPSAAEQYFSEAIAVHGPSPPLWDAIIQSLSASDVLEKSLSYFYRSPQDSKSCLALVEHANKLREHPVLGEVFTEYTRLLCAEVARAGRVSSKRMDSIYRALL